MQVSHQDGLEPSQVGLPTPKRKSYLTNRTLSLCLMLRKLSLILELSSTSRQQGMSRTYSCNKEEIIKRKSYPGNARWSRIRSQEPKI